MNTAELNSLLKPAALALTFFLCIPSTNYAATYEMGNALLELNTELSVGASWRIEDRDKRHLGQANQNLAPGSTLGSPTNNSDDGNWNFDENDTYSKIIKGHTEFKLGVDDAGLVASARYFYDFEIKDEQRAEDDTGFRRKLSEDTQDEAGADIDLLNLYVYNTFDFVRPTTVKVGRQVLNWGEGVFMQGGINVINPVDASAARAPGAQIKEILLPVNMVNVAFPINDIFSADLFYQLDWEETKDDSCGTFFSTNDTIADGCGPIILRNTTDSENENLTATGTDILPRLKDRQASDKGQYGIALRGYFDQLNGSEVGLYFINYHSRLPYFSGFVFNPLDPTPTQNLPVPFSASYFKEYPEDIRLWGLSISTALKTGTSFSAEYSFRENLPVQWNSSEIISGGFLAPYSRHLQQRMEEKNVVDPTDLYGQELKGYDRYGVSQLQLSSLHYFDQLFNANQSLFIAEVGANYIHDFPENSIARYGRADSLGIGNFDGLSVPPFITCDGEGLTFAANDNPSYCSSRGYTTQFAWGYTMAMMLEYQNVADGVTLMPQVVFSHNVNGNSPNPMGLFLEGRKSLGLTLNADYGLGRYKSGISYVRYFGGGEFNVINDRDHISASVSVLF